MPSTPATEPTSPVVDPRTSQVTGAPGTPLALLAVAMTTAVLAGCAAAASSVLLIGVAVVQVALVVSWVLGTGMPGRIGALVIGGAGCAAADASVAVWPHSALSPLLAPLGLGVLALFVHQLTRGVVRARVVESVSGTALVLVAAIALSALAQLRHEDDGRAMAVAAALTVGVALLAAGAVDLVWSHPRFDADVARGLPGLVVGIAAGAGVGLGVLHDSSALTRLHAALICAALAALAALLGVGTAFLSHGLSVGDVDGSTAGIDPDDFGVAVPSRPALRPIAIAVIPFALTAPAAYVLFLSVG